MKSAQPSWNSAERLVESLRKMQAPQRDELKDAVAQSSKLLRPLCEPLLVDSPLRQLLAKSREEAYSDSLAWCLEQLESPRSLRVLGLINAPPTAVRWLEAKREQSVASGSDGSSGRLDIRLLAGGQAIADVEVKLGDADEEEKAGTLLKQEGYRHSSNAPKVLIAKSGTQAAYHGFALRSWADICFFVRSEARSMIREDANRRDTLRASWLLAFVAAIEENLLKVPGPRVRAICNRNEPLLLSGEGREIRHLREWTTREAFNG